VTCASTKRYDEASAVTKDLQAQVQERVLPSSPESDRSVLPSMAHTNAQFASMAAPANINATETAKVPMARPAVISL